MDAGVVQGFSSALRSDHHRLDTGGGLRSRPWIRKTFARLDGDRCVYCGKGVTDSSLGISTDSWTIDHVIPLSLGGPDLARNLVLACNRCNSTKGRREWLLFGHAIDPADMLSRRSILKSRCLNHLIRDPLTEGWTKLKVRRILDARWEHPRSSVSALVRPDGVLLGAYGTARDYPHEVVALLAAQGGEKVGHYRIVQIADPVAGLDVIWRLIALNVLVRKAEPEGFPDASAAVAATPDDALWPLALRSTHGILWRGRKPGPGREPTRPGGVLPRRPEGEGWRSKKRLRDLQAMTRAVERGDLDGSRERTPPEVLEAYDALLDGLVEVYHPEAIPVLRRFHKRVRHAKRYGARAG